ncbi:flavin reductase family protein [Tardiphaga sp. 42S5]|uniref:flavin reductase family protein n=1 Tax=Tardiphaga sp. 42S5 TaxID=1404799 RepID=UPI002A598611|nr:flavin reductase [Tardiphaga sp. 42S5]WPO43258.1 flavin reductase [Tardiphaga sp. 42S5]
MNAMFRPLLSDLHDQQRHVESFKAGMRRFASGVALVTSAEDSVRAGLIATAVSSVSTSPPTLLVCVNKNSSAHGAIDRSGILCVNLLSAEDVDLVQVFSQTERRAERFASGDWRTLATGAPSLHSALVSFDCEVVERLSYGTHTIFLGAVKEVHSPEKYIDPLLYLDSAFRRVEKVDD